MKIFKVTRGPICEKNYLPIGFLMRTLGCSGILGLTIPGGRGCLNVPSCVFPEG